MPEDTRPTLRWPVATMVMTLAMICIAFVEVLVLAAFGESAYRTWFLQVPGEWLWSHPWQPFTNLVSHRVGSAGHLANLAFFLPLGWLAERWFGARIMLALYFGLGAVASTLQVIILNLATNGSSAGISVLTGALIMTTTFRHRGRWWVPMAWGVPAAFVFVAFFPGLAGSWVTDYDRIGHWSHLIGMVLGLGAGAAIEAWHRRSRAAALFALFKAVQGGQPPRL